MLFTLLTIGALTPNSLFVCFHIDIKNNYLPENLIGFFKPVSAKVINRYY